MISFWFKEAFKAIGRAKSSFILSLISTSISVLLITASIMIIHISGSFSESLKKSISINVFLQDKLNAGEISKIKSELNENRYISSINYISKEKAAEIFVKETGEDFRRILDYNPLPASFTVTLNSEFVEQDSIKKIISNLSSINGVEEVVFRHEFARKIISFLNNLKKYVFGLTGILFLISIYIVYSTVKLIINLKYEEFETMKLVGAKLSAIKMPVILNGLLIGIFAGLFSLTIFILFIYYADNYIGLQKFFTFNVLLYSALVTGTGPIIGLFVSIFSLRNLSLKI